MQRSGLKGGAVEVGKSVGISVIVTLAAVLLFAFLIKIFSIGSSVITPVNQVIKALAIFLGCLLVAGAIPRAGSKARSRGYWSFCSPISFMPSSRGRSRSGFPTCWNFYSGASRAPSAASSPSICTARSSKKRLAFFSADSVQYWKSEKKEMHYE